MNTTEKDNVMEKKIPFSQKISASLICILGSAGVIYFFDTFAHFTEKKGDQVLWIVLFGLSFAYVLNYKLEIRPLNFNFRKKNRDVEKKD